MSHKKEALKAFECLLGIMDELREKCPWDKKQTVKSLLALTIEEVYELSDAILENDADAIKKELGDILLHIVFYSKIASETTVFDITDVIRSICEKLVYRHPHIYGDTQVKDEDEVRKNWESLKLKEGNKSILAGIPKGMPPISKAQRIQDKASAAGFDWEKPADVWKKVEEEIQELKAEVDTKNSSEAIETEFGDLLFSLVNYARFLDIDPQSALERSNKKFIKRFKYIESNSTKPLNQMTLKEMDTLWEKAKTIEGQ